MAFASAREQMESGARRDDSFRYATFVDGLLLLREVPDIEQYEFVANGRIYRFSFATLSRPVASYPVWASERSPELQETGAFEDDIDMVMIPWSMTENKVHNQLLAEELVARMGGAFKECRNSAFWTLYGRLELAEVTCGAVTG